MKTVSLRVRGATADLSAMGEEVDELASATPKMQKTIKALSGVDIMDSAGNFRSLYDILVDIGEVYDDLPNTSQAALLEALGGKRNASVLASIVKNIDVLKGAYEDAGSAAGTATQANEIYLDSISGKIGKLKASFQTMSTNLFDSNAVRGVVDAGTGLLDVLNGILDTFGTMPTVVGAATAALSAFTHVGELTNQFRFPITLGIEYAHEAFN